jgi:hypothetical protein
LAGHVKCIAEKGNASRVLAGMSDTRKLERFRRRRKDNIKMEFIERKIY